MFCDLCGLRTIHPRRHRHLPHLRASLAIPHPPSSCDPPPSELSTSTFTSSTLNPPTTLHRHSSFRLHNLTLTHTPPTPPQCPQACHGLTPR